MESPWARAVDSNSLVSKSWMGLKPSLYYPLSPPHTHKDHGSLSILGDLLQQLQLMLGLGAGNACRWGWGWELTLGVGKGGREQNSV